MANKNPPVRISDDDNKIIRQQALPIKIGYYDKYPDAMKILEAPVYGKNELVLQALQFMHDCFPIDVISRESTKALSTAMGFDKNGNRLEVKTRGRKRKTSFSANVQNLSSFKSGNTKSKQVQPKSEASNESKKVEPVKEEKKDIKQIQKNDYDRQQKLKAEQEAQARKRAEAEAEANRKAEEKAMKTQQPEAEAKNGEDDFITFEPDMSFFTPPKELVPEESEKPVVPQRPQRDPNKFRVF